VSAVQFIQCNILFTFSVGKFLQGIHGIQLVFIFHTFGSKWFCVVKRRQSSQVQTLVILLL